MLKRTLYRKGKLSVLLLLLPAVTAWAEPGTRQQRSETPETFAVRLAEQHFQDFGFPTVVRADEHLGNCPSLNEEEGGLTVSFQEVVTEFVYGRQWVCVSMYAPARPGEAGIRGPKFATGKSFCMFGRLSGGEFLERQRLGIRFPDTPSDVPEEGLDEFAARLPRILNIRRAGALASAVSHFETVAGRGGTASIATARSSPQDAPPPDNSAWPLKAALIASVLALLAVTAFLFRARLQLRESTRARTTPELKAPGPAPTPTAAAEVPFEGTRTTRRTLAFGVNNAQDERRVLEIDSLLNKLTNRGVSVDELNAMIKVAKDIHALAVKENIPCPLELVKQYMADKLKATINKEHAHDRA